MAYFLIILAALSLGIWVVLAFFRGAFWQVRRFDGDSARIDVTARLPLVAVVVPARNEAETIARCLESLAAQDYAGEFPIVIVDDHSEDETGVRAQTAARTARPVEVSIEQAAPLEPGWTGKLWALQQGIDQTAGFSADYFWFTDADIVHAPDTLRRLVARAEQDRLDLASLLVMLQVKTVPERLLIPAFLYFFLMLYPPKSIANAKSKIAGAAGGCILLRKAALERMGGISAIRSEVIDDCALARAVKRGGGTIWMGLTRKSVSLRSYETLGEVRDLIARTAFTQLGYSGLVLAGTVLGMLLTYLVPLVLTFAVQPVVWRLSLTAWALMTLTYLPSVRFYGLSPLWAPLLPVAALFYSYATCLSAWRYWMKRGGQWKGRVQAVAKTSGGAQNH